MMNLNLRSTYLLLLLSAAALGACKTTSDDDATVKSQVAETEVKLLAAPEPPAPTGVINGFRIAEFEYWPFRWKESDKTCAYPYPTAIRYGFDSGSEAARKCMREAYRSLWPLLNKPPEALARLRDGGGPTTFHLWINDYTEAKMESGEPVADCQPDASMRRIWHYNPPAGVIKWVGEVYKDGTCRLRTADELIKFSEEALLAQ